jgi:preprotein translocase subunit SecF
MADRYAAVPAFSENMPIADETPRDRPSAPERAVGEDVDRGNVARPSDEALGKGRTVPVQQRPVSRSSSSGRQQPVRQSRSKRGKK